MMAVGYDTHKWENAVDETVLDKFDHNVPEEHLIVTTCHEGEPFSDVCWQAKFTFACMTNQRHPHVLIIHIDLSDRRENRVDVYKQA